ncbi:MAG: hypothetical protein AAF633_28525, partial [Chloroflexota bacterium]
MDCCGATDVDKSRFDLTGEGIDIAPSLPLSDFLSQRLGKAIGPVKMVEQLINSGTQHLVFRKRIGKYPTRTN